MSDGGGILLEMTVTHIASGKVIRTDYDVQWWKRHTREYVHRTVEWAARTGHEIVLRSVKDRKERDK